MIDLMMQDPPTPHPGYFNVMQPAQYKRYTYFPLYSAKQWKLKVSRENVLLDSPIEPAPQKLHQSSNWSNRLVHKSTTWIQMHVGRIDVELSTDVISYLLWFPPSWLLVLFWPLFPHTLRAKAVQARPLLFSSHTHIFHIRIPSLCVSADTDNFDCQGHLCGNSAPSVPFDLLITHSLQQIVTFNA